MPDTLSFEALRPISDNTINTGQGADGTDKDGDAYIDCNRMYNRDNSSVGICRGLVVGSTNDAAAIALVRCMLRGSNEKVTIPCALGVPQRYALRYLYPNGTTGNTLLIGF